MMCYAGSWMRTMFFSETCRQPQIQHNCGQRMHSLPPRLSTHRLGALSPHTSHSELQHSSVRRCTTGIFLSIEPLTQLTSAKPSCMTKTSCKDVQGQ